MPCLPTKVLRAAAGRPGDPGRRRAGVRSRDPERRARRGEPALQLGHEQHVRQLGVGVRRVGAVAPLRPGQVLEVEVAVPVRRRADDHDPVGEPRQQQVGEREVAEVVGGQVQLDAVRRGAERQRQRAGVVDQHVDWADVLRERPHRRQVGDVQQPSSTSPGIWSAAALPRSRLRTASTTWAPRSARTLAVSRPMPPLAPVTTNRRPSWRGTSRQGSTFIRRTASTRGRWGRRPGRGPAEGHLALDVRDRVAEGHGPAHGAEPVLDLLEGARQDLAGRVAALTLGEGHVQRHPELDQVVPSSSRTLWPSALALNVSNGARLPAM